MGSACCVATKDKTITIEPGSENLHRNIQYSPAWSFQWDNRGRVASEEASMSCLSDRVRRNYGSHIRYESTYRSEDRSPFEHIQSAWQKSLISEGKAAYAISPDPDQSISRNFPMDVSSEEVTGSTKSPAVSFPSPIKPSVLLPSTSSLITSSLSSQSHLNIIHSSPPRWTCRSAMNGMLQNVSDSRIRGSNSPIRYSVSDERPVLPPWDNEAPRVSCEESSNGWSKHAFPELIDTSRQQSQSFDSESFGFSHEKIKSSASRLPRSPVDMQICRVCSKPSTEKCSWSNQNIMESNELSVVSVLICGHVYHAECLEILTPENNKYDPHCPVCTFGEKRFLKLSGKALRAEVDLKARKCKRTRSRVIDNDLDSGYVEFDHLKGSTYEGGPMMASSSSLRSPLGKPFLKRHFSFRSNGSKSLLENNYSKKKGLFWAKSKRE